MQRQRACSNPALVSDAALMASDDGAAFGEVVRRHGAAVRRVARSVAPHVADEVVQKTFVSAWLGRARYDQRVGALATWLCGIARNRAIDVLRSERRHLAVQPLDRALELACPCDGPEATALRRDEARTIRRALLRITPAQRTALTLAYYGELTQSEVREHTGVPLGTVKGRLRLGAAALRRELADVA